MPADVTCPRCHKTFAAPPDAEGVWRFCPHCHELNPKGLRIEEKAAASGEVRCAKCGRPMIAGEIDPASSTCPECATAIRAGVPLSDKVVSPSVLVAGQIANNIDKGESKRSAAAGVVGAFMVAVGLLVGGCGSPLLLLGAGMIPEQFPFPLLIAVWVIGTAAIVVPGYRLMKAAGNPRGNESIWSQYKTVLMIAGLGFCGWVFVIQTCM